MKQCRLCERVNDPCFECTYPKISALDLRPLEVIVAEHNAQPGALQIGIWRRDDFERRMKCIDCRIGRAAAMVEAVQSPILC